MRVDPLPSDENKATAVREMFDRIAPTYDRMNGLMTGGLDRGWRRAVLREADLRPGDRLADVACGTGDLALLARRAGISVVGVDFSRAMLSVADGRGLAGSLVRADALATPIGTAWADAVTCGFALRNFVSIGGFLAEAARITKAGGRLVLLEVATPRNRLVRSCHRFYFQRVVPWLGSVLSEREAYTYLPRSVVYLPETDQLLRMVVEAGYERVRARRLGSGAIQVVSGVRSG